MKYHLLGVGSLIGIWPHLCKNQADTPLLIYGAGYQYGKPSKLPIGSRVFCVRGHYTCESMEIDRKYGVADPGILVPHFLPRTVEAVPGRICRYKKWHYGRLHAPSADFLSIGTSLKGLTQYGHMKANNLLAKFLYNIYSPMMTARTKGNIIQFIRGLWTCEKIESDAFHVAVLADAYGIPWKPLRWEPKWADHFNMLGIDERPTLFSLSDRARLNEKADMLLAKRNELIEYVSDLRLQN